MQRGAGVHRAPPSSEEFPPQRQQLGRAPGSVFLAAATPGTTPLGRAAPRPQRAALGAGAPGRGRGRAGGDAGEPAVLSRASGPRRGRGGGGGAMARSAEGAALLLLVSAGSGDAEPRGGRGRGRGSGRRARAPTCLPPPEQSPAPGAPSLCAEVGKGWAGCGELEPPGFGKAAGSPQACGNLPQVLLFWPPRSGPSAFSGCDPSVSWARRAEHFSRRSGLCLQPSPSDGQHGGRSGSSRAFLQVRGRSPRSGPRW